MEEIIGGTYRIIEKIGQGGSGSVYKAYHKRLEKYVVIKRISTSSLSDAAARNEVDMLKSLKHTYLPQVIDFIKSDNEAYTVMDFIDGKDLLAVRKSAKLSTTDIVRYSVQLCTAVQYLHSQNPPIIHSDIKPGNIMVTENGDICLIDFNVSLLFDKNLKAIGATPGYAAPEQLNMFGSVPKQKVAAAKPAESTAAELSDDSATEFVDDTQAQPADNNATEFIDETEIQDSDDTATEFMDKTELQDSDNTATEYLSNAQTVNQAVVSPSRTVKKGIAGIDERSDIYSIGAVIYFMITGEKPSADFENIKPLRNFNKKIPEGLIIVAEKAMSVNPRNRYQRVEDMLKALNGIMKLDRRYKSLKVRRAVVSAACFVGMTASALSAAYGYDLVLQEREDKYMGYIATADEAILSGNFDNAQKLIDEAKSFIPDNPEAYYEEIFMLYESGEYEKCINCWMSYAPSLETKDFTLKSNLYFVVGNAFFDLEDYSNAAFHYNKALSIEPDYKDCYRDLAISYVRTDRIDEAAEILDKAENAGVSDDQIFLITGEIEAHRGNYDEALEYIGKSAAATEDEYLLFRGVSIYDSIVTESGEDPQKTVQFIESNLDRFGAYRNYAAEILANQYRRLGETTGDNSWFEKAVEQYKSLTANIAQSYIAYKNCFELQYYIGDYDNALLTLKDMEKAFPEDYWVMMNYTFTYIKKQESLDNNKRSYKEVYDCFKKAEELYKTYTRNGKTDPNMDTLRAYIRQLIDGGWIEE